MDARPPAAPSMDDELQRREHDHLVEPLFAAFRERPDEGAEEPRAHHAADARLRSGRAVILWVVALVLLGGFGLWWAVA